MFIYYISKCVSMRYPRFFLSRDSRNFLSFLMSEMNMSQALFVFGRFVLERSPISRYTQLVASKIAAVKAGFKHFQTLRIRVRKHGTTLLLMVQKSQTTTVWMYKDLVQKMGY